MVPSSADSSNPKQDADDGDSQLPALKLIQSSQSLPVARLYHLDAVYLPS